MYSLINNFTWLKKTLHSFFFQEFQICDTPENEGTGTMNFQGGLADDATEKSIGIPVVVQQMNHWTPMLMERPLDLAYEFDFDLRGSWEPLWFLTTACWI